MPVDTWVSVVEENMTSWLDYELIKDICLAKNMLIPKREAYYVLLCRALNLKQKEGTPLEVAVRIFAKGDEQLIQKIIEPPLVGDSVGMRKGCCGGGKIK